jgi:hypothetical protein
MEVAGLDWIAEGGLEGFHVHKGRWGGTSHMTSQEERVFKNNKKTFKRS